MSLEDQAKELANQSADLGIEIINGVNEDDLIEGLPIEELEIIINEHFIFLFNVLKKYKELKEGT